MTIDLDAFALRRRVVRALRSTSSYLGANPDDLGHTDLPNATIADWVDTLAAKVEDALLGAEATMVEAIASIDARFQRHWSKTEPEKLLAHARRELLEIEQAMADADLRPSLRREVVAECGDVMLLVARIALAYGAEDGLHPLRMTVAKTVRRLDHFERLVAGGITPDDAWRQAKMMARRA